MENSQRPYPNSSHGSTDEINVSVDKTKNPTLFGDEYIQFPLPQEFEKKVTISSHHPEREFFFMYQT
jgi:hypothetical protein